MDEIKLPPLSEDAEGWAFWLKGLIRDYAHLAIEQDRAARQTPISQREAYQRGYAEGARSSVPAGWNLRDVIAALERSSANTDTDPRWLAASMLRELVGWETLTLAAAPTPPAQDTPGEGS
ncbi:MAG: hypothetical protein KGH75_14470 [Rhodospirillales bacterium]|nr:hypothetical protein [Rhodospirillales bacterium]